MEKNIIYLIIALIWIVTSIIKAVNKGKTKNATPTKRPSQQKNEPEKDFESILEDLILGKKNNIPNQQPETVTDDYTSYENYKPEEVYESLEKSQNDKNDFYNEYQGILSNNTGGFERLQDRALFDKSNTLNVIDLEDEDSKQVSESIFNPENFDLRKAVLYSEILKRPYF
ncbi:MAG: hypothetical protein PHT69_03680 [Bacteroidales bacterium]|nr:hypothetical protein [Bacteroidales bacterium]